MTEMETMLKASVELAQMRKQIKELNERVRELNEANANLRARLNFDLPALLRKQGG